MILLDLQGMHETSTPTGAISCISLLPELCGDESSLSQVLC